MMMRSRSQAPRTASPRSSASPREPNDPGGVTAISRWLSAATPPVIGRFVSRIPEGCQRLSTSRGPCSNHDQWGVNIHLYVESGTCRDPSGIRSSSRCLFRWCRYAQPPANGCDPFGMGFVPGFQSSLGTEGNSPFSCDAKALRSGAFRPNPQRRLTPLTRKGHV